MALRAYTAVAEIKRRDVLRLPRRYVCNPPRTLRVQQ